jgi:hypothetical protein
MTHGAGDASWDAPAGAGGARNGDVMFMVVFAKGFKHQ